MLRLEPDAAQPFCLARINTWMGIKANMQSIANRIRNKLKREIKRYYQKGAQYQKEMTLKGEEMNWYEPIIAGPSTFIDDCSCSGTIAGVASVLKKLEADQYVKFNIEYYEKGLKRFGEKWVYADINTVLYGISQNIRIESYLEIGVRRGRSMSIVAALNPEAEIVGFDMWIPNYVGMENPGPEFVQKELNKVGYQKKAEFISGDSKQTVPQFFKDNSNRFFDVITVDGDHSAKGARTDLKHVIQRLKVGGFLVFDDISNPSHLYLKKVWQKTVKNNKRFMTYCFDELGYGITFAIKKY